MILKQKFVKNIYSMNFLLNERIYTTMRVGHLYKKSWISKFLIVSSVLLNWKRWIKYAAQIAASGRIILLSTGSKQHSSSLNMNSPRASRRSKEHSERDFTQRTHVKFRISLHSQELCNVLKNNQLFDPRSLPSDRVSHCVTTSRL